MELFVEYLARFGHVIAGVVWIGMLYYFNFVQTEYFKEVTAMRGSTLSLNWCHARCGGSVGARC